MNRINITTSTKDMGESIYLGWFDKDKALKLNTTETHETSRWRTIYLTSKGNLVILYTSQCPGKSCLCFESSIQEAIELTSAGDFEAYIDNTIEDEEDDKATKNLLNIRKELLELLERTEY